MALGRLRGVSRWPGRFPTPRDNHRHSDQALITVGEVIGLKPERQMGKGEKRRDDPSGLRRYVALEAGNVTLNPEPRPRGRCKEERLAIVLEKIPVPSTVVLRAETFHHAVDGVFSDDEQPMAEEGRQELGAAFVRNQGGLGAIEYLMGHEWSPARNGKRPGQPSLVTARTHPGGAVLFLSRAANGIRMAPRATGPSPFRPAPLVSGHKKCPALFTRPGTADCT